jgi:hypothetical protein
MAGGIATGMAGWRGEPSRARHMQPREVSRPARNEPSKMARFRRYNFSAGCDADIF